MERASGVMFGDLLDAVARFEHESCPRHNRLCKWVKRDYDVYYLIDSS